MRLAVGLGGATGVVYGIRLLEVLRDAPGMETDLVLGHDARRTIAAEMAGTVEAVEALATRVHDDREGGPGLAADGMVVVPCGADLLGTLAHSLGGGQIARTADAVLRDGRTLVAVVRETPLHLGHLRAMLRLAEMGAVILPPLPAFYPRPRTVDDVVNHTVGRILDRFGIAHGLVAEWTGTAGPRRARAR
jgi:flavin prenyltransferase